MIYYYFCLVIIFLFIFLFVYQIKNDIKKHEKKLYIIPYCLLLTLLFKYNYNIDFWGLEYEDAYSFSFCARQFSYGIYPSSFLIDAVAIGSLDNPLSVFTYGGHFITYSTFLSIFTQIFGWSPQLISIVNTLIAFCIILTLALFKENNKWWFIAPSIYCAAPIINVFTTCFLSEIFSSFICIVFIYSYCKPKSHISTYLCFISFGLALLCKRENLSLLFIPIIDFIISICKLKTKEELFFQIKKTIPYLIIIYIYIFGFQNIFMIEHVESKDIGETTFSLNNFVRLFPVFITSLLSINTFSFVFYAYISYLLYYYKCNKNLLNKTVLISITLFSLYTLLYSSHYRGYFFINEEQISHFDTYRYINNFFFCIPIVFINSLSVNVQKTKIIYILTIIVLLFAFVKTIELRKFYSTLEQKERFEQVDIVSNFINKNNKPSILICENILLYQNICDSNFSVCSIILFDKINLNNNQITYYCILSDLEYLKERYNVNIDTRLFKPLLELPDGNYLYVYDSNF